MWWIYAMELGLVVGVGALSAVVGWRAAGRSAAAGLVAGSAGLVALNLPLVPAVWEPLPQPLGCVPEMLQMAAFAIVGAAARLVGDTPRGRVPLVVLALLASFHVLGSPVSLLVQGTEYAGFDGRHARDGRLPRQSTTSTCVPACAASVFRLKGVEVSEGEMAARCRTTWLGTDTMRLLRGMRQTAAEAGVAWRPRLHRGVTPEGLASLPRPCIVSVVMADVGHVVLLVDVDARGQLVVFDPLFGETRQRMAPAVFAELYQFRGEVVTVE